MATPRSIKEYLEQLQLALKDADPAMQQDAHSHLGQHVGILLIEAGVMLTVAATMLAFLYAFAGRAPDITPGAKGEEL